MLSAPLADTIRPVGGCSAGADPTRKRPIAQAFELKPVPLSVAVTLPL